MWVALTLMFEEPSCDSLTVEPASQEDIAANLAVPDALSRVALQVTDVPVEIQIKTKGSNWTAASFRIGMLIGDRESDSLASKYAESLSNWRNHRTEYHMGTEIRHLIDTVHFTHSHLSRLLQLADVHLWCRQFADLQQNTESATPS